MLILALDTATDPGSIALAEDGRLLEEVLLIAPRGFEHVLFAEIEQLLARHSVALPQIQCFAAASGPGTFTGVRAALTAAKGFAEATGGKVAGVSNLQAAAWFGSGNLRAPYRNAHRGEVYAGVFDAELRTVQAEVVTKFDAWVAGLPAGAMLQAEAQPLARAVAAIAWQRVQAGQTQDPAELDANYVRRADAEMMWQDR